MKNIESPISSLINNLVEQEISKITETNNIVIVEWMFLPYLKVWQDCNKKILINANDILRRNTAIKNNLITQKQFDECVSMAKIDYSKFDYDFIFENSYDEKSLENILSKFYIPYYIFEEIVDYVELTAKGYSKCMKWENIKSL